MRRSWPQRWLMATHAHRRFPGSAGNSMLYPLVRKTPRRTGAHVGTEPRGQLPGDEGPVHADADLDTRVRRCMSRAHPARRVPVGAGASTASTAPIGSAPPLTVRFLQPSRRSSRTRAHVLGPDADAVQPGREVREPEVESVVRTDGGERRAHVGAGEVGDHVVDAALGSDLDHDGRRVLLRVGHPAAHPDAGRPGP